jgi:uncharacterized membrane protein YsdA (DUF1294 family)
MFWTIVAIIYGTASALTLLAYGIDKHRAMGGGRRIKERTLHVYELCCGWPGGLLGQRVFRHKRAKGSYMLVFWGIVLLHLLAWFIFWRLARP